MLGKGFIFLCLIVAFVQAVVDIKQCEVKKGNEPYIGSLDLSTIQISDCDLQKDVRCVFKKGSSVSIKIPFKINQDKVEKVKTKISGKLKGSPEVLFNDFDACKDSNLNCPLIKNKDYEYVLTLPIEKNYPTVEVTVKLLLQDNEKPAKGEKKKILCVLIPAKIEGK